MPPRSRFAALRTAVLAVPGDGWHLPTPCEGWTVTQVFQHAVGDQIGYAAALTGGPGPGFDPFAPSGDLAGADPAAALEDALSRAASAWAGSRPERRRTARTAAPARRVRHRPGPRPGRRRGGRPPALPRPRPALERRVEAASCGCGVYQGGNRSPLSLSRRPGYRGGAIVFPLFGMRPECVNETAPGKPELATVG
ncbi:maleylpyruvate isomerase N-terminal domain-containing protein [Streptomyces sp. ST1015]|uniref:maleylpyruvate isomerase N-terminal domain-containing protein n=1 Tax=Streptomyces sp. ST1015 TaxID=1848900 RepID=UPI001CA6F071|nr:hypothetical protein A7X85_00495 [Streptomyces sp. ST1015]